jgi:hypothetical protein
MISSHDHSSLTSLAWPHHAPTPQSPAVDDQSRVGWRRVNPR